MLPHVGDIDIMSHHNNHLAIPRGQPPATELPAEFQSSVKVFEIIDSHLSGYVYLELRYLLTKCTNSGRYNATEYEVRNAFLRKYHTEGFEEHGPAYVHSTNFAKLLSIDVVFCVRCLSWPSQAADWPTRHRNNGWPDSATVNRVVNNGCDVVQVAHRQCRQNEWMKLFQWRLSFSRAEIVLIKSWIPVQQIVYHLLRVITKTEKCTQSAENSGVSTLSNYHIKTLMLWACELKPQSWWTGDLSLTRISVELLHTLAVWLTETRCPHYFINNCNLLDKSFAVETLARRLLRIDKYWLSSWFITSYIKQSIQICPESVSRLFEDVRTSTKLENAVSAVVHWRLNTTTVDLWLAFYFSKIQIEGVVYKYYVTEWSCICWMTEFSKIDPCLSAYLTAVLQLEAVRNIKIGSANDTLMNAVAVTTAHFVSSYRYISSYYYDERMSSLLNKVVVMARKCQPLALNSIDCNTYASELVELLQQSAIELLSTLRRFEARDFGSVATTVTTDFDALYAYKHGDYQRCLQLSADNVRKLWFARGNMPHVSMSPMFIELFDDDIVSLVALTLIINPKCTDESKYYTVTQLTLSLYLMTQCQLKLRHSLTSLTQTFNYIEVAQRKHDVRSTLDQLTLRLIERK